VIDLDVLAALRPPAEINQFPCVRLLECARRHLALGALGESHGRQVTAQNVVAGVAAVPVDVQPRLPECLPLIVILGRSSFDGEFRQGGGGRTDGRALEAGAGRDARQRDAAPPSHIDSYQPPLAAVLITTII